MPDASPTVLLDASLSMGTAGGRWVEALDSVRAAGRGGEVIRFGREVVAFDTTAPNGGATRLAEALAVAHGRGAPVVVITDGEVDDLTAVDPSLLERVRVVVLPRAAVPNGSLIEAAVPERATAQDTIPVAFAVEFTGEAAADSAVVEVLEGTRRLARTAVPVTPRGLVRRTVALAPALLGAGEHLLRVRLHLAGDAEPRDNERIRRLTIAPEPAVTVIAAPGDWEARFLVSTLAEIVRVPIQAYAMVRAGQWVNMRTLGPAAETDVLRQARSANLVVRLGSARIPDDVGGVWRWRGGDSSASVLAGDWYVMRDPPPSPLAGRLAGVAWDSLPPLTGVVPMLPEPGAWTGLAARLGRRGAERPVLSGRDSAGARRLVVNGDGLWRWALRGGAPREAYRALVAAGADWLLGTGATREGEPLTAPTAVTQGIPAVFRWAAGDPPDSAVVGLSGADARQVTLRFDAEGRATVELEPGVYRWVLVSSASTREPGRASGTLVVEEYSDEFRSRAVTATPAPGSGGFLSTFRHARERVWLFALALAALVAEWTWRLRRGLP
jgi:hypothetical protein